MKTLRRFVASTSSHSSSSISQNGRMIVRAALLTRTSMRPYRSTAAPKARSNDARSRTSSGSGVARSPRPTATDSAPSRSTSVTTTLAPRADNARAISFPMPCAAPVTSAVRASIATGSAGGRADWTGAARDAGLLERNLRRELDAERGGAEERHGLVVVVGHDRPALHVAPHALERELPQVRGPTCDVHDVPHDLDGVVCRDDLREPGPCEPLLHPELEERARLDLGAMAPDHRPRRLEQDLHLRERRLDERVGRFALFRDRSLDELHGARGYAE